jgi:hypothetical protein
MNKLTEKGTLLVASFVLGIVTMLVMFGCSSTSVMSCENLLAEEKQDCLERVRNQDNARRFQMETNGNMR